jgi:hypothetical protein
MKVSHHLMASGLISGGLYAATRSIPLAVASFVFGWLIDIDHLVDYVIEHGPRADVPYFFSTYRDNRYRRARLVLHGWEWPVLVAIAGRKVPCHGWLAGVALGWLQHLAFDQLTNAPRTLGYSIVWRALRGFRYVKAFPGSAAAPGKER